MRHNQGFSLIELMVVIAISAILISGAVIGMRYLTYSDAEKVAKSIDSSLSKLQLETMSTGNQYFYLAIEWDATEKVYYVSNVTSTAAVTQSNWGTAIKTVTNRKKLAGENIMIAYSTHADGSDAIAVRDVTKVLLLNYKPSSGAFQSNCQQITVTSSGKVKKLQLILLTGNHYVE